MHTVYGYLRVSTKKQGDNVSLPVQKEDILRYAKQHNLIITKWYEEKQSASKLKRPMFKHMLKSLQEGKAEGFIAHKIDRISRNYHDWAKVLELHDRGYQIHCAHEKLNLGERGSRLTANIQLAMASDYSFNLAQEAKKGLYGRLKQGYYPFHAPLGYLNQGAGKVKTIDPVASSFIKKLFEFYAYEGYSIRELVKKMRAIGFRNRNNKPLAKNSIISILKNPFYTGVIRIKGQFFQGNHSPLISQDLFQRVQDIMHGKCNAKTKKHNLLFRKKLRCKECGYTLIGEKQKGHIYYRCHTKGCLTKSIREDVVEQYIGSLLRSISFIEEELTIMKDYIAANQHNAQKHHQSLSRTLRIQQASLKERQDRLTDLLVDGTLSKEQYQEQQNKIVEQERSLLEQEATLVEESDVIFSSMEQFLELAKNPVYLYQLADIDEKRALLEIIISNLEVSGKRLYISMYSPFYLLLKRDELKFGGPTPPNHRNKAFTISFHSPMTSLVVPQPLNERTLRQLYTRLLEELPSLSHLNPLNDYAPQIHHPLPE